MMPKALYRLLREETLENPNPYLIFPGVERQTSDQLKDYFLCSECEQRFSDSGECWVMRNCFRGKGKFLLRDMLLTAVPLISAERTWAFATADVPEIDIDALAFFAVSVVWRAAAHTWHTRGTSNPRLRLGPYEESLRLFLNRESGFPANVALAVWVSAHTKPLLAVKFPHSHRVKGYTVHSFHIPGVYFHLSVGKQIEESSLKTCIVRGMGHHVLLSTHPEGVMLDALQKRLRTFGTGALNESPTRYTP